MNSDVWAETTLTDARVNGDTAEERNAHLSGHLLGTAGGGCKDLRALVALGTHVAAHVLHDADDVHPHLPSTRPHTCACSVSLFLPRFTSHTRIVHCRDVPNGINNNIGLGLSMVQVHTFAESTVYGRRGYLFAEVDFFAHIHQRHFLRRRHHDRTVDRVRQLEVLSDAPEHTGHVLCVMGHFSALSHCACLV